MPPAQFSWTFWFVLVPLASEAFGVVFEGFGLDDVDIEDAVDEKVGCLV